VFYGVQVRVHPLSNEFARYRPIADETPRPSSARRQHAFLATSAALRLQVVAVAALGLLLSGCDRIFGLEPVAEPQDYYPCDCECSGNVTAPGAIVYASPGGVVAGLAPNVNAGKVLEGPQSTSDGRRWWRVDLDTGPDGWIQQPFLQISNVPPVFAKTANVCLPAVYNPYLGGSSANLDLPALAQFCASDVIDEVSAVFAGEHDFPVFCSCLAEELPSENFYATSCEMACPGGDDLCLVEGSDPPDPTPQPFSAALFQPISECRVAGDGVLVADGDHPKEEPHFEGTLEIQGRACPPGAGCNVGMFYKVTSTDLEFDSGTIFASDPKFVDLGLIGSTEPDIIALGPFFTGSYLGEVPAGSAFSSAHGRRSGSADGFVFNARNAEGLALAVTWDDKFCRIGGDVAGQATGDGDEGTFDATLDVGLEGPMENQPPRPSAGADQTVECTSPDGALVTLDALGSTDPDGNLALYEWRRGSPDGALLASPSLNPAVQTQQALGSETYYVLVADSRTSADGDSITADVVDTNGADISCNAPATIDPTDVPERQRTGLSFTATAQDLCGGISSLEIGSVSCTRPTSCHAEAQGATLTIHDSSGVGNVISWIVSAEDGAGNTSQKTCSLTVVKKS
jgi:hypothetical protein